MKVAKRDSIYEKKLQKVEALLTKLGIQIFVIGNQIFIENLKDEQEFVLMDIESGDYVDSLPRLTESEKMVLS